MVGLVLDLMLQRLVLLELGLLGFLLWYVVDERGEGDDRVLGLIEVG